MSRLIDVDKFKAVNGMKDDCADCDKELRGKSKACEFDRVYTKMDFCGWLDDAPTVDAVPVVRCRDCEHKDRESGFCHGRGWPMQLVPDDGFCDKGKRLNNPQTYKSIYGERKDGGNGTAEKTEKTV